MSNARNTALKILLKIENDGAYSNIALNNELKKSDLSGVDKAFASALVYGVLERRLTLDHIIKQYSKIPLRKIETAVRLILRLGVLQLVFMDRVPDSAAVNESVRLAKKHGLVRSSGFINGVLRSIVRADKKYSLPDKKDKELYLSIKYSLSRDTVALWLRSYGEQNVEGLLESLSGRSELYARVNTLKTTPDRLIEELASQGVTAKPSKVLPNAVRLCGTGGVERLSAFENGEFHIQDISSQLCVDVLSPKEGHTVLDVCSAPGGKAFTAAQYMNNCGKIYACDMYDHKLSLIKSGAQRLGINCITAIKRDAAGGEKLPTADRILCDVPCSGLGVLSRKPEIRYKDNLIENELPSLQYDILCKSSRCLAAGGLLVYSTCTLNPAENNENIKRFLSEHPDFEGEPLRLPRGIKRSIDEQDCEITLMPHACRSDGFYIAALRRKF